MPRLRSTKAKQARRGLRDGCEDGSGETGEGVSRPKQASTSGQHLCSSLPYLLRRDHRRGDGSASVCSPFARTQAHASSCRRWRASMLCML